MYDQSKTALSHTNLRKPYLKLHYDYSHTNKQWHSCKYRPKARSNIQTLSLKGKSPLLSDPHCSSRHWPCSLSVALSLSLIPGAGSATFFSLYSSVAGAIDAHHGKTKTDLSDALLPHPPLLSVTDMQGPQHHQNSSGASGVLTVQPLPNGHPSRKRNQPPAHDHRACYR